MYGVPLFLEIMEQEKVWHYQLSNSYDSVTAREPQDLLL